VGVELTAHKRCVFLIFSTTLSEIFFMRRGIRRGVITNVHMSLCKVSVIM